MSRQVKSMIFLFFILSTISNVFTTNIPESNNKKRTIGSLLNDRAGENTFSLILQPPPAILTDSELSDTITSDGLVFRRLLTPHPDHTKRAKTAGDEKDEKQKHQGVFNFPSISKVSSFQPVLASVPPPQKSHHSSPPTSVRGTQKHHWKLDFMNAIQANDPSRLSKVITQHKEANANFKISSPLDPSRFTYPLHFALQHKLLDVATQIIDEIEFDPNAKDSMSHTALSLTLENGEYSLFKDLLSVSDLNVQVLDGYNLVHLAASMQSVSPVFLIDLKTAGADFSVACKKHNRTVLQYAVAANNLVLIKWINENTDCTLSGDVRNKSVLLETLKDKNYHLVKELINHGAVLDCVDKETGKNILHFIAESGIIRLLDLVLDLDSIDFDDFLMQTDLERGFCPAHYAAQHNFIDFLDDIRAFADLASFLTRSGKTVLHVAIDYGRIDILNYFLRCELIDSYDGLIIYIYQHAPDFESKIAFIETIMNYFTSVSNHRSATLFSESKEETEQKEEKEQKQEEDKVCQVSAEDLEDEFLYSVNADNLNVLHLAVIEDDFDFIQRLVFDFEFDVDNFAYGKSTKPANSPLAWAIYLQKPKIVKFLLSGGASPHEMVLMSSFSLDEPVKDVEDPENIKSLTELVSVFGNSEISSLFANIK